MVHLDETMVHDAGMTTTGAGRRATAAATTDPAASPPPQTAPTAPPAPRHTTPPTPAAPLVPGADTARIADGFPGERLRVLARPLLTEALTRPVTRRLLVTDCGYFPHAARHGRERGQGADQTIVMVCVDGAGWCRLPSGEHRVRAGQTVVIPAGTPHAYGAEPEHPWTIWWLHLAGTDVAELVRAAGLGVERPVTSLREPLRAAALIEQALAVMERDDAQPSLMAAAGAAWHLMTRVATDQAPDQDRPDPVAQVIGYLQTSVGRRVAVADLASMVALSPSHFSALFRRATGYGVLEYQTRLRMARARELLDISDRPVADVARTVGYADPLYFTRQFRHVHGVTPSAYRQAAKG